MLQGREFVWKLGARLSFQGAGAFNRDRRTFRAQDDDMTDYFSVQFKNLPFYVGEEIKASVKWTEYRGIGQKINVTLQVLRIEGDKVWLREPNGQIALTVRVLE